MSDPVFEPPYDLLHATAERVMAERADADPEMTREVFTEAATLLHDGLALDGLDEHDARVVVAGLCEDMLAEDPGDAVKARAEAALKEPGDLHDPQGVSFSLDLIRAIFQL